MNDVQKMAEGHLQAYWQRVLEETVEDYRKVVSDSEALAMIPDVMAHTALARMAERDGGAVLAAQLRMIADKFAAAAVQEQQAVRH